VANTLANRADLRKALMRLLNTTTDDEALTEQGEAANEVLHLCLQHGLWNAQEWVLTYIDSSRWLSTSSALTWSGTDETGGMYASLPTDFLRLAGDDRRSALREANGDRWGALIDEEDAYRYQLRGNYYYLRNEQLWRVRGASPPSTVQLEYHHRHADLSSDDPAVAPIDFPLVDRPLIVSEAAEFGLAESWFLGTAEDEARIRRANADRRKQAVRRGRRTRKPVQFKPMATIGTHYIV
jgi:hypothetical protein